MAKKKFDFSGWATRNNIKCMDGRTIRRDAFKDNDGETVPLVWQHLHNSPENILGHAVLENRADGVYAYCSFNNSPLAQRAKEAVQHGDISSLSIYANQLKERAGNVLHGTIREVSLVLAGANKGARIDFPILAHSDEPYNECVIYNDNGDTHLIHYAEEEDEMHDDFEEYDDELDEEDYDDFEEYDDEEDDEYDDLEHSAEDDGPTIAEVIDTMNEDQKAAMYAMIAIAANKNGGDAGEVEHGGIYEGDDSMYNAFEAQSGYGEADTYVLQHSAIHMEPGCELEHDAMTTIIEDAKRYGSLKESFLSHAAEYGIDQIDWLFPEYKSLNTPPDWVSRDMEWVKGVLNNVHKTPFSRIKSMFADIREDDARAKGYMKGNRKKEEVFTLLKRTTDPQTIYKKQKFDRDDIIDITDFDVIAWVKAEMRMMLDEEIARAILVGDGRPTSSEDKIQETHVRPIYTDDDFYAIHKQVEVAADADEDTIAKATIRAAIKSRKDYKGSGNPTFYTTEDALSDMLLLENGIGELMYTMETLKNALRVSAIVTVPVMEGLSRDVRISENQTKRMPLLGIIVNLKDYNVGADKGGAVEMFEDFDIDYNQQKYLIETRMSGALIKPFSAIVLELNKASA